MAIGRTRQLSISPGMTPDMMRLIGEQRQINKEFDRRKPVTAPSVFNNDASRPAARDNPGRIIFVRQANNSFVGQYSDGSAWQTFLATAVSYATPTVTFGTAYAQGSATTTMRSDATFKYPAALMSTANSSTLTLTDDATDQTLTGSLGVIKLISATNQVQFDYWNSAGASAPVVGTVLTFAALTSNVGATLNLGIDAGVNLNDASTHSGSLFGIKATAAAVNTAGATYSALTIKAMQAVISPATHSTNTHTFTERTGMDITVGSALQSGSGVVTVTDTHGIRVSGFPTIGTGGTQTNARAARLQLPTIGATIRRGCSVESSSTGNVGTEAANVEGFYCEDIPRGTARRVNYFAEGATTGTPTDVYAFYQQTAHVVGTNRYGARYTGATTGTPTLAVGVYCDAHAVGTTKWSFYANDESRMVGVQQDDNAKDVFGTGRDAEIYYDGTDLVIDPDVVGTGVADIRGGIKVDSVTNDTGLAHGVYTPTRSAEANMDANVTPTEAQYLRVGNTVTVSGRFTANPTLTATATSFELTLPVASNIGAAEDLAGTAFCGAIAGQGAEVIGSVANNTAVVQWVATDVTSQPWAYTYTYQVI